MVSAPGVTFLCHSLQIGNFNQQAREVEEINYLCQGLHTTQLNGMFCQRISILCTYIRMLNFSSKKTTGLILLIQFLQLLSSLEIKQPSNQTLGTAWLPLPTYSSEALRAVLLLFTHLPQGNYPPTLWWDEWWLSHKRWSAQGQHWRLQWQIAKSWRATANLHVNLHPF